MFGNKRHFQQSKIQRFGMVGKCHILIFPIYYSTFSPFSRHINDFWIFTRKQRENILYYLIFLLVDASPCINCISFLREKNFWQGALHVIPQRLVYRWLNVTLFCLEVSEKIERRNAKLGILKKNR